MGARDEMRVSAPCTGASSADGEGPAFLLFCVFGSIPRRGFGEGTVFPLRFLEGRHPWLLGSLLLFYFSKSLLISRA